MVEVCVKTRAITAKDEFPPVTVTESALSKAADRSRMKTAKSGCIPGRLAL